MRADATGRDSTVPQNYRKPLAYDFRDGPHGGEIDFAVCVRVVRVQGSLHTAVCSGEYRCKYGVNVVINSRFAVSQAIDIYLGCCVQTAASSESTISGTEGIRMNLTACEIMEQRIPEWRMNSDNSVR